ncbi:hypothetical protein EV207_12813 [Scopulibacillus darangshiensis]|uniref:Methyltransferase family protein n=1 Tax=Scopulibacillus darangshiensis TaxID=442528 RepID=A0A4R2NPT3_9BACL|nr:class I SAM-dependent methyltransferase [Scopulibacillus darangshiensis]TCP23790.1 hypothetical protein EV207_12813 [Scopulibacillus darangshiensis]
MSDSLNSGNRKKIVKGDDKDILLALKKLIDPSYSLLDVGCGLCSSLSEYNCKIIAGLEIHRPYLEQRKCKHPHIIPINANALEMDKLFLPKTFTTVLFNDSIEHFKKRDGIHLLNIAEEIATDKVIVFTPRGYFPQKDFDYFNMGGEKYQKHRSGWESRDFLDMGYNVTIFKDFHGPNNSSFRQAYGDNHPPIDAILAWKDIAKKQAN